MLVHDLGAGTGEHGKSTLSNCFSIFTMQFESPMITINVYKTVDVHVEHPGFTDSSL